MDWDHDTCLSCDRHIADGEKFCSQTCRLADLEQAGHSEQINPSSLPTNSPSWMTWQSQSSSLSSTRSQFQLSPAVNFSSYKTGSIESPPASPRSALAPRQQQSTSSYFAQTSTASYHQPTGRGLTTSPSRSSLSSVSSTSSSNPSGISDHAANLLRAYSGAFDQDRNWKRRVTTG